MIESEVAGTIEPKEDLRPNLAMLIVGVAVVALVSGLFLPWPVATVSTALGALMIAGADVDARTYLLPDAVTWGAVGVGLAVAPLLAPADPWLAVSSALMRALGTAVVLEFLRRTYARVRCREGLGFGDVKLGAAVGAWLPFDVIPLCFALATSAALVTVVVGHLRGRPIETATKLPFGAFLCPALWLIFFANSLLE